VELICAALETEIAELAEEDKMQYIRPGHISTSLSLYAYGQTAKW